MHFFFNLVEYKIILLTLATSYNIIIIRFAELYNNYYYCKIVNYIILFFNNWKIVGSRT